MYSPDNPPLISPTYKEYKPSIYLEEKSLISEPYTADLGNKHQKIQDLIQQ
nr:MAG TPA: hypothetical protein [Caudoviricetes sp.]